MFSWEKIVANTEIFLTRNELLYIGIQILIGFEQILNQKKKNSNQEVKWNFLWERLLKNLERNKL